MVQEYIPVIFRSTRKIRILHLLQCINKLCIIRDFHLNIGTKPMQIPIGTLTTGHIKPVPVQHGMRTGKNHQIRCNLCNPLCHLLISGNRRLTLIGFRMANFRYSNRRMRYHKPFHNHAFTFFPLHYSLFDIFKRKVRTAHIKKTAASRIGLPSRLMMIQAVHCSADSRFAAHVSRSSLPYRYLSASFLKADMVLLFSRAGIMADSFVLFLSICALAIASYVSSMS